MVALTLPRASSAIVVEQLDIGACAERFIEVARRIYADDPAWIQPLDQELAGRLDPSSAFFEHGSAAAFIAVRDGVDVGRATAQIDELHLKRYDDATGFFGFFDTIDDPAVATALVEAAAAWLAARGMQRMRGPLSISMKDEVGCLIDGFEHSPVVGMPHHRAYQGALLEKAGLVKEKDFYAWRLAAADVVRDPQLDRQLLLRNRPEVTIRAASRRRLEADLRQVQAIFSDAWHDGWGTVDVTPRELEEAIAALLPIVDPELILLAEVHGEPAACAVTLPNLNEAIADLGGKLSTVGKAKLLWRLKVSQPRSARGLLVGIAKKFRSGEQRMLELGPALFADMRDRMCARFDWAEFSWTDEANMPVNVVLARTGARVYKRYRVYQRTL